MRKKLLPVFLLTVLTFSSFYNEPRQGVWIDFNKNGTLDVYENVGEPIERRVEDLLSQMTTNEKTCQLVTLYGYGAFLKDRLPERSWKDSIWKDGIANIDEQLTGYRKDTIYAYPYSSHTVAINKIQKWFIEETRLGIPVDFTTEGIRGLNHMKATYYPAQIAQGSSFDADLVYKIGEVTGREARALGYTNVYSPILDVSSDPRWGRIEETYGSDPFLVGTLGKENIKGIQKSGVISTVKHFAVYSVPVGGRDGSVRTDPHVAPREMWNLYLEPFRMAFQEAGAKGVMASYNDYDGVPIISSHYFLTDILRKKFGFKGYVVSDSHALEDLFAKHHVAKDTADAAAMALKAGLNVRTEFKNPADYVRGLRRAIKIGAISMEIIDQRVREVLKTKFELGLFDNPYREAGEADKIVHEEYAKNLALRAAREGIVLLENKQSFLPLSTRNLKSVALIGPNVKEYNSLLSRYGPAHAAVKTVYEGIEEALSSQTKLLYAQGCEHIDTNFPESDISKFPLTAKEEEKIQHAVSIAKKAETVIIAVGDSDKTIGETKSRLSLKLPGHQEELVTRILALKKPTIILLVGGRPVTFNFDKDVVSAILETWYLGEYTGQAIADVLFGNYNPGGKLPVPFPKSVGQIPLSFPMKPSADAHGQGDANVSGFLYPFGYGLSYTSFAYTDLSVDKSLYDSNKKIKVSFLLKNTGVRSGEEVAQLYFTDEVSSVTTYVKNLRGFRRVALKAGEERRVEFELSEYDLSLLNREMNRVTESGWFKIMIGASSEDIRLEKRIEL